MTACRGLIKKEVPIAWPLSGSSACHTASLAIFCGESFSEFKGSAAACRELESQTRPPPKEENPLEKSLRGKCAKEPEDKTGEDLEEKTETDLR